MAKFRYSLQNILNIKEKMETQAKQEFGTAQAALNVETEHLSSVGLHISRWFIYFWAN